MTSTPLRGARHRPDDAGPAPFTSDDFAARMARAAASAEQAGLAGVMVTPGPDLLYLSGYAPVAITERITMLVVAPDREPTMIVPVLERPDAEAAPSASRLQLVDWRDGTNPYEAAAALLDPRGRYAISDSAWSMHLLGLIEQLPESRYVSMTEALPMLRAVKTPTSCSGCRARPRRPTPPTTTSSRCPSPAARRPRSAPTWPTCCASTAIHRSTSPSSGPAPTVPTRIMRSASG